MSGLTEKGGAVVYDEDAEVLAKMGHKQVRSPTRKWTSNSE